MQTHDQPVGEHGHLVEQLIENRSAFCLCGVAPQPIQVDAVEQRSNLIEALSKVVRLCNLFCCSRGVLVMRFDQRRDARLLLAELIAGDVSVVMKLQQLAAPCVQLLEHLRRPCRPAGPSFGRFPPLRQMPADCFS